MPQAWRSESESPSTAMPRSTSRPSSSPSTSRARARLSRSETRVRHVPSMPSQTLSSTEHDSATSTSWKTVTMPRRWACCGVDSGGTTWPSSSISPASGVCTPLRILTIVDLPQPFSPTSARTSPARSSNEASRTAWVAPNAFATLVTRRSGAACVRA